MADISSWLPKAASLSESGEGVPGNAGQTAHVFPPVTARRNCADAQAIPPRNNCMAHVLLPKMAFSCDNSHMDQINGFAPSRIDQNTKIPHRTRAEHAEKSAFTLGATGIGLVLGLGFAAAALFTSPSDRFWIHEGGVVETATVVFYAACLLYMPLRGGSSFLRRHPFVPVLTMALLARELDLHKRLTGVGIFKIRFFTDPSLPATTKVAGAFVVAGLAAACLYSLWRYWPVYSRALRRRSPVAIAITLIGALIVVSKMIDGLDRNLASLGTHLSAEANHVACAAEEILELGIPLFGLLSLRLVFLRRRFEPSFEPILLAHSRKRGQSSLSAHDH